MAPERRYSRTDFENLAERLIALDSEAYQEFADYFGPALLRFFVQKGLDSGDAEDLASPVSGSSNGGRIEMLYGFFLACQGGIGLG